MHPSRWILYVLIGISTHGVAQNTPQETTENIKTIIDNKDFRFIPQSATTSKGNTLAVDPGSLVKILNDSVYVDLPVFETSYTTNFGQSENEIKYQSKKFSYQAGSTDKGWTITITPKDETTINRMTMTVTPKGYCTLQLRCRNQQPITYNGVIGDNLSN